MQLSETHERNTYSQYQPSSWQQTWEYGELQSTSQRTVRRFLIQNETTTIGFFQIIFYPVFGKQTIAYIPYGPVWLVEPDKKLLLGFTKQLMTVAYANNALFVRYHPLWGDPDLPTVGNRVPNWAYRTSFSQPRGEMIMDLSLESDVLFSQLHKNTRRNVRKSLDNTNLHTEFYRGSDMSEQLDTFIAINEQNTSDHNTTTHSREYFTNLFDILSLSENNFVAATYFNNTAVAVNIFVVWNKQAFCPFGASTKIGKEQRAYYRIKWDALMHLQNMGIRSFNWGGVSLGYGDEYLSGVDQFKRGWNGEIIDHGPTYDLICHRMWYIAYMLRTLVKKIL